MIIIPERDERTYYAVVCYDCREGRPIKVASYSSSRFYDTSNKEYERVYQDVLSCNFYVVKDGFQTREQAESYAKICKKERK